ncbi:MAG: type II toxin-antitoxin system VapC family toxin [Acidobacteria bacterium]|nr:type II toxin-antitoxin system VapC family toxin [Acidobacteriota bacterium]
MTRYLLDTNVISELHKPRPHGGVVNWVSGLHLNQMFLSAVTLGEIQRGIERTKKNDPEKAEEIEQWADQMEQSANILPMSAPCFRQWATLMEGRPHHLAEDAMIAATALVHGLQIATRNAKDFSSLGVKTFNPFRSPS